ncbi:MAG: NRDE family protein [Bacteroidales bacterium]|nr:NRDE family protein [Bacteroidales bacterium]
MCTVTYIPPTKKRGFILTSNRDEKEFRPTSPPEIYRHFDIPVGFPRDAKAGGSWIAANENGRLCCLLNGAYIPHTKEPDYTRSRGNVLLQLATSPLSVESFFMKDSLTNVEPFTIVTFEQKNATPVFTEFVWDGKEKHFRELDKDAPYIWSSVTLYSEEHRNIRNEWFNQFFQKSNNDISPEDVFGFHSGTHTNDNSINVIMQRDGGLKTVSITQVIPKEGKLLMRYTDLLNNSNHQIEV